MAREGIVCATNLSGHTLYINSIGICTYINFIFAVLPELVGKWYTKMPNIISSINDSLQSMSDEASGGGCVEQKIWCYCRSEEFAQMIGCDSKDCEIEWFHTSCLKLTFIPKGKWLCPNCHKKKKQNRKK